MESLVPRLRHELQKRFGEAVRWPDIRQELERLQLSPRDIRDEVHAYLDRAELLTDPVGNHHFYLLSLYTPRAGEEPPTPAWLLRAPPKQQQAIWATLASLPLPLAVAVSLAGSVEPASWVWYVLLAVVASGLLVLPAVPRRALRELFQLAERAALRLKWRQALENWFEYADDEILRPAIRRAIDRHTFLSQSTVSLTGTAARRDHPSSTTVRTGSVRRFLEVARRSRSGAIALAGPRGVGKTTLIHSYQHELFRDTTRQPPLAVIASAPVRYEPRDFVLHLHSLLCRQVIAATHGAGGDTATRYGQHRRRLERRVRIGDRLRRAARLSLRLLGYFLVLETLALWLGRGHPFLLPAIVRDSALFVLTNRPETAWEGAGYSCVLLVAGAAAVDLLFTAGPAVPLVLREIRAFGDGLRSRQVVDDRIALRSLPRSSCAGFASCRLTPLAGRASSVCR